MFRRAVAGWGRCAVGVFAFLAAAGVSAETRYALLAGCNTYADGLTPLATSLNDIQGMKDRVLCASGGFWPSANTVMLKNSQATRQRVRDEIAAAAETCQDGDVFFFMYSGHGSQDYDYEYYELICLYDYDYGDWELGQDLAQFSSGVKVVIALDTCYSGGMFKSASRTEQTRATTFAERVLAAYQAAKQASPRGEALVSKAALGENIAFMTASDQFELSWTFTSGYSLYTGYLLDAVSGEASDANGDGALSLKEMHDYAAPRVVAETEGEELQSPQSFHPAVLDSILVRGEPDVIRMESAGVTVSEGGGLATVRLLREGKGAQAVSVGVITVGETAVPGKDFTALVGKTVTWAAGDLSPKSVSVALSEDALDEGVETFWIWCADPQSALLDESRAAALVTIQDNDVGAGGSVRFATSSASVAESAGFVALSVTRAGGSTGTAQVRYRTVAGSASAGADYVGTEGVLAWGPGDTAPQTLRVPVLPDAQWESNELFSVELFDAAGAGLVSPALATVTIANAGTVKTPGKVRLAPSALSVCEADGVARVTVSREGGTDGAVEVTVLAVPGTAKAGVNFAATNAVLRWAHGDAAAQVLDIALLNDGAYRADLTFKLQLSNYRGGLAGAPNGTAAAVTVRDALATERLSDALDNGSWAVASGGAGGWYGQAGESADGAGAAQLYGSAIAKGKDAWLQTSVTGPGAVSFAWRGWAQAEDLLQFYVGAVLKTQLVGRTDWERVEELPVPPGKQVLKWRFVKMSAVTNLGDTAWVDQVVWQPDAAKPAGPKPSTGGLVTSDPQRVAWQAAAGAVSYAVYLGASSSVQTQLLGTTSEAWLALPALTPGKSYYWRVDAVSAADRVTKGTAWSFRIPAGALARVEPPADQAATVGLPFRLALTLREGSPAATSYSVKGLPTGLTASAGGVISGRPARAGTNVVYVAALNAFGTGPTETLALTVSALPAAMAGQFAGLAGVGDDANGTDRSLCGAAQLTVSTAGAISGSVRLMGGTYGFSGTFLRDEEGVFYQTSIRLKNGNVSTLQIWPHEEESLVQQGYRGRLFTTNQLAELVLTRNTWAANKPALAEYAGYYTVALPLGGNNAGGPMPLGTGYLTVKLEATGMATLAGVMADGTAWSGSTTAFFAPDGEGLILPVFAPLYSGSGQFWGALRLAPNATGVADNAAAPYLGSWVADIAPSAKDGLLWYSGARASSRLYPAGFYLDLAASGGAYNTGSMSLQARLGKRGHLLELNVDPVSDAALDPSVAIALSENTLWLPSAGPANRCGTTFAVNALTGIFTGTFALSDDVSGSTVTRKVAYKGILAPMRWTFGEAVYASPGSGFFTVSGLTPSTATSQITSLGAQLLWVPLE